MAKLPSDVAIRVHDIHKDFHLPHYKSNSIKDSIVHAFEKKDKDADTFHALDGISFDINKGEFFGILGRNGSGKSTLLKIISEIYQPTSGSVSHKGSLVSFIELGVGFKAELTGRENIYLNGALLGFSKSEIDDRYDEIVAFAELEEFMEQKIKNYSSGMKVRLAFAVAIQAKSDILVLDEVLAVGDASFQRKCYEYFKSLKNDNSKTIVFVTHSMGAVKDYCDKAILIEGGKIIKQGEADEVADAYTQLFNQSDDPNKKQSSERWGSNEIQFTDIKTKITKKKVIVECDVTNGNEDIDEVIIAFDIYDSNKKLVGGVDNEIQRNNQLRFKAGESKRVTYQFDNIFGGGDYTATVALKSQDGSRVYDLWRQAVSFSNVNDVDTYFPVIFPVEITVK